MLAWRWFSFMGLLANVLNSPKENIVWGRKIRRSCWLNFVIPSLQRKVWKCLCLFLQCGLLRYLVKTSNIQFYFEFAVKRLSATFECSAQCKRYGLTNFHKKIRSSYPRWDGTPYSCFGTVHRSLIPKFTFICEITCMYVSTYFFPYLCNNQSVI